MHQSQVLTSEEIIEKLPYTKPFLFVDAIDEIKDDYIEGHYTFPADSYFYEGHFVGNPVTPGVILTECMAQIGLVCLGINILAAKDYDLKSNAMVAMCETNVQFLAPVYPDEKVIVKSELQYFRMHKLKCTVNLYRANGEKACKGTLSGMLIPSK